MIASERAVVIIVEASNGDGAVTDEVSVGDTREGGLLSLRVACGPRDGEPAHAQRATYPLALASRPGGLACTRHAADVRLRRRWARLA